MTTTADDKATPDHARAVDGKEGAMTPNPAAILVFGRFRLHTDPLRLCCGDEELRLGGRALDLLSALVSRPGEVLSRSELEAKVWPHSVVEDSSLRVHIAALRRALGDGIDGAHYIANVPGRGYRFVAAVASVAPESGPSVPSAPTLQVLDNLPTRLTRLIGREAVVDSLAAELARCRKPGWPALINWPTWLCRLLL